jgi:N-acetylglucosamine-6-phosphate deacetylase
MPPKAVVNAKVIVGHEVVSGVTLLFDRKVIAVGNDISLHGLEVIDAAGMYVSPGFIDIHIHGSGGADVMDGTPQALETICKTVPQTGTTSFLATTMTMSEEQIIRALENVRTCKETLPGAQVLGVHLEGPFINAAKHGAQDATYVQRPHTAWLDAYADVVRMITLAPEVPGGMDFVRECMRKYEHIILSIGHSEADYAESMAGFDAGISHVTHLFNAMPPYHHREPGIVGACFDRDDVTCDVIADLVHTHPHHLRLVQQMKRENLILITDAMRAGCMRCGTYDLGGREVTVSENRAVLEDGTLAGSVLRMNEALRHMRDHTGISLTEAVASVTLVPARKLRISKGELKSGYDADIVIFDEDFSIISTIVAGEVVYQRSV